MTGSEVANTEPQLEIKPCLVLICKDAASTVEGLDLPAISARLQSNLASVAVRIVERLCEQPKAVGSALDDDPAERIVMGICAGEFPEIEVHAQMRRHGVDPLGLQTAVIGDRHEARSDGAWASSRVELLLAAAVERARAFRRSLPENLRASLASSNTRVSRRALFTVPPVSYDTAPTVAMGKCAASDGCYECVEACPQDALSLDGDRVAVDRSQCNSCGVCVAACPHRAVEFPGASHQEIERQIATLVSIESDLTERDVAFVCKNAASPPSPWLPVKVSCAAAVTNAAILQALAGGASTVEISSCGDKCPNSTPAILEGRVDYCREVLRRLGDPPFSERVQLDGAGGDQAAVPDALPLTGEPSTGALVAFGRSAPAQAILALTQRTETGSLALDHEHSPLGRIDIDEATCIGCGSCAFACPSGAFVGCQPKWDRLLIETLS